VLVIEFSFIFSDICDNNCLKDQVVAVIVIVFPALSFIFICLLNTILFVHWLKYYV